MKFELRKPIEACVIVPSTHSLANNKPSLLLELAHCSNHHLVLKTAAVLLTTATNSTKTLGCFTQNNYSIILVSEVITAAVLYFSNERNKETLFIIATISNQLNRK